ncbi:MAG: T9SS type A sorting domain-containing protein, partial [Methanolobus sp.]|uniref:T9SS type A sorting domain-containing protein n=1 Tax=Methanolobus sp. TaxID=1874737 RepID=UPI0027316697
LARWLSVAEWVALFFGGVALNMRTNGSIVSYYSIRINQNVQNIRIRGFSITNSKSGIVLGQNSASIITNCALHGNASSYGGGINLFKGTTVLSGVRIFDNYAYIMAGGIYINGYMGSVNVTFDPVNRCSIYNNTAGAGQDIVAHSINNDLSIPLDMFTVANPTSYYAASFRASGNEFQLLIDAETAHHQEVNSDLYVSPNGDDTNDGLSPATALKTIRTAVYRVASDSLNQKTVHILPGVYSRTANQQVFPIPLKSWVKVQGAGIAETQIVGEMDPAYANVQYNALKVFTSFYQTHTSLEDLSITSTGSNNSCAIWGHKEVSLHLKNLRIHELSPDLFAIINITYATNCLWDEIIIEDFTTDSMGFMYSDGYMTGVIRNSIFRNAVNNFTSNEVWGYPLVWIVLGENFLLENSIFTNLAMADDDSQALSFGGMYNPPIQQQYTISNSLFSNITCNQRGVIFHGEDYPIMNFTNCTFAGHTGNGEALMVNGNVTISNSIFYNERSVEIAINPMDGTGIPTTLTLDNNLIRNGYNDIWQGPGSTINYHDTNISGNPLFQGGDDIDDPLYYSLSAASPCINTGTPDISSLGLPPYDLAGNWRVWNGIIDIGCFEYGSQPWVSNDDPVAPAIPETSLTAYPNPFSVFTNIKVSSLGSDGARAERIDKASISIYNLKGQRVKSIMLDPAKTGEQITYWDGRDADNTRCSSGIYFVNLIVNGRNVSTRKVTYIR